MLDFQQADQSLEELLEAHICIIKFLVYLCSNGNTFTANVSRNSRGQYVLKKFLVRRGGEGPRAPCWLSCHHITLSSLGNTLFP